MRIAAGPAHHSPALRILDAVHGVEPPAAYARFFELSGMFPPPPGEGTIKAPGVSLDPVCDTLPVQGSQTTTVYAYARVCRGSDGGTDTLQNQRTRLTDASVAATHIHQDIVTGTVMQRSGLNRCQGEMRRGIG